MSRMYHNEPLASIPVNTHHIDFVWDKAQSGPGVILEGSIAKRSRHVIIDSHQSKKRYFVLHITPEKCHQRKFDTFGVEIEPNFSETQKVRQGYLHSSYKTAAKGDSDQLTVDQAKSKLMAADQEKVVQSHKPSGGNILSLWILEQELGKIELENGDCVRIKTKGDSPFIDSLAKLDVQAAVVRNYAGGEQVGGSWTDKVMSVKADASQTLPQDQLEGVDEDEWSD